MTKTLIICGPTCGCGIAYASDMPKCPNCGKENLGLPKGSVVSQSPAPVAGAVEALRLAEELKWQVDEAKTLVFNAAQPCEYEHIRMPRIQAAWNAIDRLAALAARPSPPTMLNGLTEAESQWQPIETAPRDGTHILATLPDSDTCHVICWVDASKGIRVGCGVYGWHVAWDGYPCAGYSTPTRWMPLPAPPTVGSGSATEGQANG